MLLLFFLGKGGYKKDEVKKNILGIVSDVRQKVTLDWTENCNEIYDAYMVADF